MQSLHPSETSRQLSIVAQDVVNNSPVIMAFSDIETEGLNWAYNNGPIQLVDQPSFCLDVTSKPSHYAAVDR